MDALDCIRNRRSIRSFLSKEVDFEKIGNLLDAARVAPSAGNLQDWKFIIVYERDVKQKIADACAHQEWIASAPLIIIVCADIAKDTDFYGPRGELYAIQAASAATQNILLAATATGLGSCWVGAFPDDTIRTILGIPQHVTPCSIIPIGYYSGAAETLPKKRLDDVTFFHTWGNATKSLLAAQGEYYKYVEKFLSKGKSILNK